VFPLAKRFGSRPFFLFCACRRGSRHDLFRFHRISGAFAEQPVPVSVIRTSSSMRTPRFSSGCRCLLNGDDHAGLERGAVSPGREHRADDGQAVNEIVPSGLSGDLAVGIYYCRHFVDALVALDTEVHSGFRAARLRFALRDDVIDFALARRELAVAGSVRVMSEE